jgi:hypothetical protein
MLDLREIIEPYMSEAEAQARAFMEAGGTIPGYKVVAKRAGWDGWQDDKKVDGFLARQGLSLEERREPWKPITPAAARTVLKAKGRDMKDGSKDRKQLEKYVKPGVSSGFNIVRSDDPRPAIQSTPEMVKSLAAKIGSLAAPE